MMKWNRLLVAVFLAGCSEPAPAPAPGAADTASAAAGSASSGLKACDLLSAAQIGAIIGAALEAGVTTNDYMGVSQCRFDRTDDSQAVMISLHDHGDLGNYERVPGAVPASGLGDGAVWNAGTQQLAVRDGAAVLSISFLLPAARQEWAEQLARDALAARHATETVQ